jgi:hypothetical protein
VTAPAYVYITWTTPDGRTRRSFAAAPTTSSNGLLVSYSLVAKDTDGKGETVIGFAKDSSIRVRPARLNLKYCELEVV